MKTKAQIIEGIIESAIAALIENESTITLKMRWQFKMIKPNQEELRQRLGQEILMLKAQNVQQEEGIEILKEMLEKENNPKPSKL